MTDETHPHELDPVISAALENPRNRLFVMRLEYNLTNFIKNEREHSMVMAKLNSFYRLLVHKIADHYKLGHVSAQDGSSVSIYKLADQVIDLSSISRIVDITGSEESPTSSNKPTIKPKLLRNPSRTPPSEQMSPSSTPPSTECSLSSSKTEGTPQQQQQQQQQNPPASSRSSSSASSSVSMSATPQAKGLGSFEAREAAYQEARARIFKDFKQQEDQQQNQNQESDRTKNPLWDPEYLRF